MICFQLIHSIGNNQRVQVYVEKSIIIAFSNRGINFFDIRTHGCIFNLNLMNTGFGILKASAKRLRISGIFELGLKKSRLITTNVIENG